MNLEILLKRLRVCLDRVFLELLRAHADFNLTLLLSWLTEVEGGMTEDRCKSSCKILNHSLTSLGVYKLTYVGGEVEVVPVRVSICSFNSKHQIVLDMRARSIEAHVHQQRLL